MISVRAFFAPLSCLALASVIAACGEDAPPPATPAASTKIFAPVHDEVHFSEVRQLTFGGENAEAYWAFGGKQLIMQARGEGQDCDRIVRMSTEGAHAVTPVSNGKGATTCSYFLPGDQEVIYASTQLGGEACPPKPDMSLGYVWALYDTYDIFRANVDGTNVRQLTNAKGYDAEATVCKKDGSIVFTSTRDGDIDLYRMDKDGSNVVRLTNTPGYDGGAFFNDDCSKLVWRASRPKPGKELDDYRALLAKGLVRPSKLELMVGNADGSDPTQITYLDAASFAPYFHPDGKRILFSSNYGDPKGREFDIFMVNVDGSGLERVTHAKGFDGFPMFSPDGKELAFSSNRATAEGKHDTNVFIAKWVDSPAPAAKNGAGAAGEGAFDAVRVERAAADVRFLADDAREGRGVGTKGLDEAGAYIEKRFGDLGLEPAGDKGTFRQEFKVVTALERGADTEVILDGTKLDATASVPFGFSANGSVDAPMVLAGYGIVAKEFKIDDYKGLDVKGKIVVVRRFVPETKELAVPEHQRKYGDLRYKAYTAREHGAKGIIVVDAPEKPKDANADWAPPKEAKLPMLMPEGSTGDAGIVAMAVTRDAFAPTLTKLEKKQSAKAKLRAAFTAKESTAFNVVGRLKSRAPKPYAGALVVGAHYDHLGLGGHYSLSPNEHAVHHGADDNASGVAALLETARDLTQAKEPLARDVTFIAFSGEEMGTLGSSHFVKTKGNSDVFAMLNMDMVGRLRANKLEIMGGDTADEWKQIAEAACERARVGCTVGGGGYGPSDHMPFYAAGVPVLFFFTGQHKDYHKPSDEASRINAAGIAQVSRVVTDIARGVTAHEGKLTFKSAPAPLPHGDTRSFHASLGTVPDYAGPGAGKTGVLLSGVREGSAAEKGGLKRGDILVGLGTHDVRSVEDLMFVLNSSKPGEKVTARVMRDGKEVKLDVTFEEGKGR